MKRSQLAVLAGAAAAIAAAVVAGVIAPASPASGGDRGRGGYRALYFAISCGFSHMNRDDAIVYPRRPGLSHHHTYFGNTTTAASSTPASLRAAGSTSCRLRADTAAYWVPTLMVGGDEVEPLRATVYYVRRTLDQVQAFPAGLKMIAGNAAASTAQSRSITFWSCGGRGVSSSVPACGLGQSLRLQVNYPNCWNGRTLDSTNHKSHMAYSVEGVCPASHSVEVPALTLVVRYPVSGGAGTMLASGGQLSAHADFINAWDQDTLEGLVDRYLNRSGRRGR